MPDTPAPGSPGIDADRLWSRLMALAEITDPDAPWTRRSFTLLFLKGRAWVQAEFEAAGLEVRIDAGGNLIGRLPGRGNGAPVMIGSHSDSVPSGGRFDGMLGLLGALEVAQAIREAGVVPDRDIEVVDFLAEEPSDFGLSCIGSRAMTGGLTDEMLALRHPDGRTLAEAIAEVGGRPDAIAATALGPGALSAFLEIHIEQAKRLEGSGTDIGVVTGIAGIRRWRVTLEGRADHSGATPMGQRMDALVAAAPLVEAVEAMAEAFDPAAGLVATVGRIEVSPNAANAVPGRVALIVEVRAVQVAALDAFAEALTARAEARGAERGVAVTVAPVSATLPAPCAPEMQQAIAQAAEAAGLSHMPLNSGAGHDAAFLSQIAPAGMIFTPCRDGRSHTPEEWADPKHCADGARVLLGAVMSIVAPMGGPT